MIEKTTASSFIIRIYRYDDEDPSNLTGIVESMDGTENRTPFTDGAHLLTALNSLINKEKQSVRHSRRKS